MSTKIKTVPNQKVIKINKEQCGKGNLFANINLEAMNRAAQDLDGNCFKLWMYFAKNQNNYSFALSSKEAKTTFGLKIDTYNRAIKILQEKNYLIAVGGNQYNFYEIPRTDAEMEQIISLNGKTDNSVNGNSGNSVNWKTHKGLTEIQIRNNTYNTYNNTNNTDGFVF